MEDLPVWQTMLARFPEATCLIPFYELFCSSSLSHQCSGWRDLAESCQKNWKQHESHMALL